MHSVYFLKTFWSSFDERPDRSSSLNDVFPGWNFENRFQPWLSIMITWKKNTRILLLVSLTLFGIFKLRKHFLSKKNFRFHHFNGVRLYIKLWCKSFQDLRIRINDERTFKTGNFWLNLNHWKMVMRCYNLLNQKLYLTQYVME